MARRNINRARNQQRTAHEDVDRARGAVEGEPGQRAGEFYGRGGGYGELYGEGDWGWRGQYEHRYGEYAASEATRRGWDPRRERRPEPVHRWRDNRAEAGRGPHAGVGPKGYRRSDERIREEVCERLMQHGGVDASDVEVEVRDGEVTLSGTVDSRWAKRQAEDVAEGVFGVRDVRNHLQRRRG